MQLYVTQKGQQAGPFPIETVKGMLERRELAPTDLVWHEGAPGWMPLSSFTAVQAASSPASPVPSMQPSAPRPVHVPHSDAVLRALAGIKGLEGMSMAEIQAEVQRGAVFVRYQFCISVLVMTFKRSSGIHFIKGGHSRVGPGGWVFFHFTHLRLVGNSLGPDLDNHNGFDKFQWRQRPHGSGDRRDDEQEPGLSWPSIPNFEWRAKNGINRFTRK